MERHWSDSLHYTAPNATVYPYQWLWDSCFHAIIWSLLEDSRCVTELEQLFTVQQPDGFLPHMGYHGDPEAARSLWGVDGHSTITQPPMFGHALAVLHRRGYEVAHLIAPATRAFEHLFEWRSDASTGLLRIIHPWESGCDDSPRWDAYRPNLDLAWWRAEKIRLVQSIAHTPSGSGWRNPSFEVLSASFNALTAFNATELASISGDAHLRGAADALRSAITATYDGGVLTWVDLNGDGTVLSQTDTAESLLPLLLELPEEQRSAAAAFTDPNRFEAPFGPSQVATRDAMFNARQYWRGPAWPQLTYLHLVAAARSGNQDLVEHLRRRLIGSVVTSGFAEYNDPLDGTGLGAIPQSWSGLVLAATLPMREL